jgi:hypothetical protein
LLIASGAGKVVVALVVITAVGAALEEVDFSIVAE